MSKGFEIGSPTPEIWALPLVTLALNNPVGTRLRYYSVYHHCSQTWYRRDTMAVYLLFIFRGKFGIRYSRFRKYSLLIALSIDIWLDLNRFSIHESILLVIKFAHFGESSIHDSPENWDFESILDSLNRTTLISPYPRAIFGVKSVWELALMLVPPVGLPLLRGGGPSDASIVLAQNLLSLIHTHAPCC